MRIPALAGIVLCVTALPAAAQPFSSAKSSAAGYPTATVTAPQTCESLSSFKGEGITTIQARVVPATADTPQHCRVVGNIEPDMQRIGTGTPGGDVVSTACGGVLPEAHR